jgi:hypothetical protein
VKEEREMVSQSETSAKKFNIFLNQNLAFSQFNIPKENEALVSQTNLFFGVIPCVGEAGSLSDNKNNNASTRRPWVMLHLRT